MLPIARHSPCPGDEGPGRDIGAVEAMLADWFDAEVVLTSSGRAALRLALADLGLARYRDRIAVSPMTAACVFEAVIHHGFPVDPAEAEPAAATVLIHQFGHAQRWRPEGPVVEDVAHAFFAGAETGARDWAGEHAIFSLPKFFGIAGMAGGVVTRSRDIAARIRNKIASIDFPSADQSLDRQVFRLSGPDPAAIGAMYARRLLDPRPDPQSLTGLPDTAGMRAVGTCRAEIVARLLATPAAAALPEDWRASLQHALPYAFPLFGDVERLRRIDEALSAANVSAGLYSIDLARDNRQPDLRRAVLIPCHHEIAPDQLDAIERAMAA